MRELAAAVSAVAAAGVVVAAITFAPASPQRQRSFDAHRVVDLSKVSAAVDSYYAKSANVPASLDTLVRAHVLARVPTDPQTRAPYYYWASGSTSYRLCATFAHPSDSEPPSLTPSMHSWRHGAGESCFDVVVSTSAH